MLLNSSIHFYADDSTGETTIRVQAVRKCPSAGESQQAATCVQNRYLLGASLRMGPTWCNLPSKVHKSARSPPKKPHSL